MYRRCVDAIKKWWVFQLFRASVSDKNRAGQKNQKSGRNGEFMFKQFTMELAGRTLTS